jgi:hypothetical protein
MYMYPQIENVIPRNLIIFLPCILRRPERIADGKLDVVLLRDPEFTPRLSAKLDVCREVKSQKHTRASETTPPLMAMIFALGPLSATPGVITKEGNIRTDLYPWFGWIADISYR